MSSVMLAATAFALHLCQVMPVLQRYNKQLVEVEGVYWGDSHGIALVGRNCKQHFSTKGYTWTDGISLARPGDYLGRRLEKEVPDIPFSLNATSVDVLSKALERSKSTTPRGSIRLVVTGLLLTGGADYVVSGEPPFSFDGFGHFGRFPAVLVIREIKSAEVFRE